MFEVAPVSVSVILVNYNGKRLLAQCLTPLSKQTHSPFEIVLVDNASTDDSCAFAEKNFPGVKLVRSETNAGFAAGNNLGFRHARGELIGTLNTDTRVEADYIERMAAPFSDARVGATAPLMLEMERPDIVDAAGIRVDRFGFAWNIGAGQAANKFVTAGRVYGACAGAAMYRRAMLDQIGFFDDAYFGFYEDADLAWRAHNAGWETMFVPGARVYHMHGASFGKISPYKTYLLARNRWWTTFKNYPMPQFYFALPIILALDAVSLLQSGTRGHLGAAWRGRAEAWRGRKTMWAKHQAQTAKRNARDAA